MTRLKILASHSIGLKANILYFNHDYLSPRSSALNGINPGTIMLLFRKDQDILLFQQEYFRLLSWGHTCHSLVFTVAVTLRPLTFSPQYLLCKVLLPIMSYSLQNLLRPQLELNPTWSFYIIAHGSLLKSVCFSHHQTNI